MPDSALMGNNEDSLEQGPDRAPEERGDGEERGKSKNLLEVSRKVAAKRAVALWTDQDDFMREPEAQWKVNVLRRRGTPNVKLIKKKDVNQWVAWAPPNSGAAVPVANKLATLCRRLVAKMFADPPIPDPVPSSGEDSDRDAAILAGRVLMDVQGEQNLNDIKMGRRSLDRGCDYGSGFVYYTVDAAGGGTTPRAVQASSVAETLEQATAFPAPYIRRYVREDQTLTDKPEEAETRPLPKLRSEVVTGKNCRLLPHTAEDIWDAHGCMLASFPTWSTIKKRFPGIEEKLSPEEMRRIREFKPDGWEARIPHKKRVGAERRDEDSDKDILRDEDLVFCLTIYYEEGGDYPDGACIIALGDVTTVYRSTWFATIDGRREPLELPLTQYKMFEEGREGFWPGVGLSEILGPGNEIRAAQVAALLEHLDKFGNRKTFIPTNSIVNVKQLMLPTGAPIPINPGGKPEFEDIPRFPRESGLMFSMMTDEMDNASGLEQAGQGVNDPNVKSGRQALTLVSQVDAGLSDLRQNMAAAYTRGSRIQLQLIRAFYTLPQQVGYTGDDGEHRVNEFRAADLRSTRDVRIKIGSLSMMTPAAKVEIAERYAGFLDPMEVKNMVTGGLGGTIGLEDNPHRMRVKRQIAKWQKGPPEEWSPPEPQKQLDPDTNQQVLVPVPDPISTGIFQPIPADELPDVAVVRAWELARAMSSTKYSRWPQEWRAAYDQAFQISRFQAGIQTIQEQAEAAVAQAAQQGTAVGEGPPGAPANERAELTPAEEASITPPPAA